ncbi:MAG: agmatine deiminase family protein [Candidatus Eisenbacteria bacterium]|nr:agmatine deiminase family protein [Candidatus Eisenbacteria bacterium]
MLTRPTSCLGSAGRVGSLLSLLAGAALTTLALPQPALAEWDVDGIEELLPREESPREYEMWRGHEDELARLQSLRAADPPPMAPIRNCAEWEPLTGVLIRYPLGLPYNLIRDLDDHLTVHVVVSSGNFAAAQSNFTNQGVDMSKVEWLIKPNDSIWTRDYGPWFVFDGEDNLGIIDHTYNRPQRPNDNLIPIEFANQQGIPVYSHDMYHTGGNYMTDGFHVSSSTALVYNEAASHNGMTQTEVDQLMFDYYGIENYEVLDYIEPTGIHHIDTWAKFLDEETVLVKDVWSTHVSYANLNQRATLLASLPSSTGRNYDVHRVYCYNLGNGTPASYTNSLLANERVYVPLFGNATYDADAIAAYQAAMPGYDVRGYTYSGFLSDDALHCRTKGVMDSEMLRVEHVSVQDAQVGDVDIAAFAHSYGGHAITNAEIVYRQDGGAWTTSPLSPIGGDDYVGTIPMPSIVTTTDYYVHFEDASGREEGMPRSEPAGWYSFDHSPDPSSVGDGDLAGGDGGNGPGGIGQDGRLPGAELLPNYPNPFPSATTFRFDLAYADQAELMVFDPQGRLVRTLFHGEAAAGRNEIEWDGKDDRGRDVPSGVYYYRLRAAGLQYTRPAQITR